MNDSSGDVTEFLRLAASNPGDHESRKAKHCK